jgi:hypothetical protein
MQTCASVSAPSIDGARVNFRIRGAGCRTVTVCPPPSTTQPADFQRALRLSLRRSTLSAEQLVELAAAEASRLRSTRLLQRITAQLAGLAAMEPFEDALLLHAASSGRKRLEAVLQRWQEDAPAGEADDQQMRVPGVAGKGGCSGLALRCRLRWCD